MTIQTSLESKIRSQFQPEYIEIENESNKHSVAPGSETHFRVLIVSNQFQGQSRVERQRKIYQLVADEFKAGLHALALYVFTPEEWQKKQSINTESPQCKGGSNRLP